MKLASLFRREPEPALSYDRDALTPVIRCSICNGEQTAGFRNRETGRFEEVMLIRSDQDLREFMRRYGITETPEKIY